MANFIFVRMRKTPQFSDVLGQLRRICLDLTPEEIQHCCENKAEAWPKYPDTFYAIQNSGGLCVPVNDVMTIGWAMSSKGADLELPNDEKVDGSYAIVKASKDEVHFFTDQFGSRSLWYFQNSEMLVISTSQRAVVQLKGSFCPNESAMSWFLSSGCQGPYISWDEQIQQARPNLEYVFKSETWDTHSSQKTNLSIPESGTGDASSYNSIFERCVTQTMGEIVGGHGEGESLLPLSGGLDSRLLLALAYRAGFDSSLALVNWGVAAKKPEFADKVAAKLVADFYQKPILDQKLPEVIDDFDGVLERFVLASEGRIDQFNAYADGFKMWADFVSNGFKYALRGDIPFTEGIDIGEASARAHIGLEMFADYDNSESLNVVKLAALQQQFDIERKPGESLIRWRDRLYVEWRVPIVISAFSTITGSYLENRCPMMSWSLYQQYMALPDCAKGDKAHIDALWKLHDKSKIPSNATTSLMSPSAYFETVLGLEYLCERISQVSKTGFFSGAMVEGVSARLNDLRLRQTPLAGGFGLKARVRASLSEHTPSALKGWLKAKRPRSLSVITLAYRIVLVDKILKSYNLQAKLDNNLRVKHDGSMNRPQK